MRNQSPPHEPAASCLASHDGQDLLCGSDVVRRLELDPVTIELEPPCKLRNVCYQVISPTHLTLIMNLLAMPAQSLYTRINVTASRGRQAWLHRSLRRLGSNSARTTPIWMPLSIGSAGRTSCPVLPWRLHFRHRRSSVLGLEELLIDWAAWMRRRHQLRPA